MALDVALSLLQEKTGNTIDSLLYVVPSLSQREVRDMNKLVSKLTEKTRELFVESIAIISQTKEQKCCGEWSNARRLPFSK